MCVLVISPLRSSSRIHDILPARVEHKYCLKRPRALPLVKCNTKRLQNSFLPYAIKNWDVFPKWYCIQYQLNVKRNTKRSLNSFLLYATKNWDVFPRKLHLPWEPAQINKVTANQYFTSGRETQKTHPLRRFLAPRRPRVINFIFLFQSFTRDISHSMEKNDIVYNIN